MIRRILKNKTVFTAVSMAAMLTFVFNGVTAGYALPKTDLTKNTDCLRKRAGSPNVLDELPGTFSQDMKKDGGSDASLQQAITMTVQDLTNGFLRAVNGKGTADLIDKPEGTLFVGGHELATALSESNQSAPAINLVYFNMVEGLLRAAEENNAGIIVEVARSQLGYALNARQAVEYITEVANRIGITVPIVLHGDHIQYTEKLFKAKDILKQVYEEENGKGSFDKVKDSWGNIDISYFEKAQKKLKENGISERKAIRDINEELIKAGFTSIAIDASTIFDEAAADAVMNYYAQHGSAAEKLVIKLENEFRLPIEWGTDFLKANPARKKKMLDNMMAKVRSDMEIRHRSQDEIEKHLAYMEETFGVLVKKAKENKLTQRSVIKAYDKIMLELSQATNYGQLQDEVLRSMSEKQKLLLLTVNNNQETGWQFQEIDRLVARLRPDLVGKFGKEAEVGHVDRLMFNPRTGKMEPKMTHPSAVKIMAEHLMSLGLYFDWIATNNGSGHGTEFDKKTLTPVSQVGKITPWLTAEFIRVLAAIPGCKARIAQHGTSGSDNDELTDLSNVGVTKFNIATIYQQTLLNILALSDDGMGDEELIEYCRANMDLLNKGLNERTREKIKLFAKIAQDRVEPFTIYDDESYFTRILKGTYNWGVNPKKGKITAASTQGDIGKVLAKEFKRVMKDMDSALYELGHAFAYHINVLKNNISLLKGAQTGESNIEHAVLEKANGVLLNHSEWRERMENLMMLTVDTVAGDRMSQTDYLRLMKMNTGLEQEDIMMTWRWIRDDAEKGSKEESERELEKEKMARQIVNLVVNRELKALIEYAKTTGYVFGEVVVCVGETKDQYDMGRTRSVLEQDTTQILESITGYEALKINLRKAYEPRYAIGTGIVPSPDEIQTAHSYIKDYTEDTTGVRFSVDYGGSFKEKITDEITARDIAILPDVDGVLIGGAGKKIATIEPIVDIFTEIYDETGKVLHIGVNWKAEVASTGLDSVKDFTKMLKTKDLTKVEFTISTPVAGIVGPAMAETEKYLAKTSPAVEALIEKLRESIESGDQLARKDVIEEIANVSPAMRKFLNIFLIAKSGRIDAEQIAALRSRLMKESFSEISPKRIAVFGSNNVARLAIKEIVRDGYDNLELVAAIGESAKDLFPFIIRDSHDGPFPGRVPGRAELKEDAGFFYLGEQKEAIKVLSAKDFINAEYDFPWEALALDVALIDEKMYKNIGEEGVKKLNEKGIQVVVSRVAGEGFITYIPGMSDQAKIQEESLIRVASTQETAVGLALQGLSELGGEIKFGDVHVVQPQYSSIPPSYRVKSAYQTTHIEENLFEDVLREAGIDPKRFALTSVIKTQIPRGEAVEVTVGVDGNVSKEQVIECFKELAEGSNILALPEEGVALSSNVIWGEKRIFFEPNIVYVNPYPGGTEIKVLFLIDENTAHVAQILDAVSGKPSQELVKAEVEKVKELYAESEILTNLANRIKVSEKEKEEQKAKETAEKIQAIKDAKTTILNAPGYSWSRQSSEIQLLLAEEAEELLGRFEILYRDNKPVGIYVYNPQKNTLIASSLLTPSSLEETQETALEYYSELRNAALLASVSAGNVDIEVIDVYKPEEKLRTKFVISAKNPAKTRFESVERLIGSEWTTLAEPNVWLDPQDFKNNYTVAINALGGRIGSLAMKEMAGEKNLRVLAAGGPTAEQLADFLKEGDTVQGPFKGGIKHGRDWIEMDGKRTIILSNRVDETFRNPANFPWISFLLAGIPVDVALDATGQFLTEDALNSHREAGALRAWPTAPGKGDWFKQSTFVMNVNEGDYDPDKHFVGSNASCTTGCLSMIDMVAELAYALHEQKHIPGAKARINRDDFINAKEEIKREMMKREFEDFSLYGLMVTLHALTGEILGPDVVGAMKKATRKRDAGGSIIPTSTGAAAAIGLVDLARTEMDGFAIRFPTDVGSLVIANYILDGIFTREEFVAAAELVEEITTDGVKLINVDDSGRIKMLEEYKKMMAVISPDKIQVINFINDQGAPTSMVKISGWYENEAYYAHEVVRFINEVMRPQENHQLKLTVNEQGRIEGDYDGRKAIAKAAEEKKARLEATNEAKIKIGQYLQKAAIFESLLPPSLSENEIAAFRTLFGEFNPRLFQDREELKAPDGKTVGVVVIDTDAPEIINTAPLFIPEPGESTSKTLTEYYAALRNYALEYSAKNNNIIVEVKDMSKPEEGLRVTFFVNAETPNKLTFSSLEQMVDGRWGLLNNKREEMITAGELVDFIAKVTDGGIAIANAVEEVKQYLRKAAGQEDPLPLGENGIAAFTKLFGEFDPYSHQFREELKAPDGKTVGVVVIDTDTPEIINTAALFISEDGESTYEISSKYYAALTKYALEYSDKNNNLTVEVKDMAKPEKGLRITFFVNAETPAKLTFSSVDQRVDGRWVRIDDTRETIIAKANYEAKGTELTRYFNPNFGSTIEAEKISGEARKVHSLSGGKKYAVVVNSGILKNPDAIMTLENLKIQLGKGGNMEFVYHADHLNGMDLQEAKEQLGVDLGAVSALNNFKGFITKGSFDVVVVGGNSQDVITQLKEKKIEATEIIVLGDSKYVNQFEFANVRRVTLDPPAGRGEMSLMSRGLRGAVELIPIGERVDGEITQEDLGEELSELLSVGTDRSFHVKQVNIGEKTVAEFEKYVRDLILKIGV